MSITSPDDTTEADIIEALEHLSSLPSSPHRDQWIDARLDELLERRGTHTATA